MGTAERYRVNRLSSRIVHVGVITATVAIVLALAGLTERALGFGNIILIWLLLPVLLGGYYQRRILFSVDEGGVVVRGKKILWAEVAGLVVVGRTRGGDAVEIGVRRVRGFGGLAPVGQEEDAEGFAVRVAVPRRAFDPQRLRAAVRAFAPATVTLTGWVVDELGPAADDADRGEPGDHPASDTEDAEPPPPARRRRSPSVDPVVLIGAGLALLVGTTVAVRAVTPDDTATRDPDASAPGQRRSSPAEPRREEHTTSSPSSEPPHGEEILRYGEPGLLFDQVYKEGVPLTYRRVVGSFTVTDVVLDPPACQQYNNPVYPAHVRRRSLQVDLYFEILDDLPEWYRTIEGEPYVYAFPGAIADWPLPFTVADAAGERVRSAIPCSEHSGSFFRRQLGPGQAWAGSVILEVPFTLTHGSLTFPAFGGPTGLAYTWEF